MPCNAEHMAANRLEVTISRLKMMIDEVEFDVPVDSSSSNWDGYHPEVYCRAITNQEADDLAQHLCSMLTECPDVTIFTLEVQTWWRDHQQADAAREQAEQATKLRNQRIEQAKAKLTEEERQILGLDD